MQFLAPAGCGGYKEFVLTIKKFIIPLKIAALGFAIYAVALPLFEKGGQNFGISQGLLLAAFLFIAYAFLAITGAVFQPDGKGNRLDLFDLLLLGAFPLYLVYFGNERFLSSLDTLSTRQVPLAILKNGTIDLSGQKLFSSNRTSYSVILIDGKVLSSFPLGTALLAVPHTALAMRAAGTDGAGLDSLLWEKHFASLATVASVLFLFTALRKKFAESVALKTACVFALATSVFSCASQAMWSFTGELFFLTMVFFLIMNHSSALAGIAMGAAFLCRPTALIFVAIAAPFLYLENRRETSIFLITSLVSVLGFAGLLSFWYGHPLGGYGMMNQDATFWHGNFWSALGGNLISPSRGLLIFYPFLVAVVLVLTLTKQWNRWQLASFFSIATFVCLASFYSRWWGGHSLGPRLLTETSPFLAFLTIPVWKEWKNLGWIRFVFAAFLLYSIFTQFLLVYNPAASEWSSVVSLDANLDVLWSWTDGQLAAAWSL